MVVKAKPTPEERRCMVKFRRWLRAIEKHEITPKPPTAQEKP